jgi:hypothetical protein
MPAGAGVAQLVEQWFCKPQVGGSTPSAGTNTDSYGGPGPTGRSVEPDGIRLIIPA